MTITRTNGDVTIIPENISPERLSENSFIWKTSTTNIQERYIFRYNELDYRRRGNQ